MRSRNKKAFVGCLVVLFILSILVTGSSHQWIQNIDRLSFNEPSGIVFHPGRDTLFVVGDEGDVCEIKRNGALVKRKRIRDADFEGITCDPVTGLLYIAVEGEEKIIEIDPEEFRVLREFVIERIFRGATVLRAGGQGIEGIALVPDSRCREGGTFYVVNQGLNLDDKEDPPAVFVLDVPLRPGPGGGNVATIRRYFFLGLIDLSGLCYDESSDHLYVVSGAMNALLEITREGEVMRSLVLPGDNQEGIALDAEGFLYIAQDSGGIIKVKWNRDR